LLTTYAAAAKPADAVAPNMPARPTGALLGSPPASSSFVLYVVATDVLASALIVLHRFFTRSGTKLGMHSMNHITRRSQNTPPRKSKNKRRFYLFLYESVKCVTLPSMKKSYKKKKPSQPAKKTGRKNALTNYDEKTRKKSGKFALKLSKRKPRTTEKQYEPRIAKKKQYGQHFLTKQSVVDNMVQEVTITQDTHVMEIGCGSGFLTRTILNQSPCKALHIYEIDTEWADYICKNIEDSRIQMNTINVLDVDLSTLKKHSPLVLLANLPYQITFPLFYRFAENSDLFTQGVVMIQEEVAQKIVATRGRPYSAASLYLQHYFSFKLLEKIGPESFSPPPKVDSRLLYFEPKAVRPEIPNAEKFWKFLRLCFASPRQTLRNNLARTHIDVTKIDEKLLKLRAQQISFETFLHIWEQLRSETQAV